LGVAVLRSEKLATREKEREHLPFEAATEQQLVKTEKISMCAVATVNLCRSIEAIKSRATLSTSTPELISIAGHIKFHARL
jgi:hypothetical protein